MKDWPPYLDLPKRGTSAGNGKAPAQSNERDRTGSYYWTCPSCGARVGGYVITGTGPDDWSYEQDNFCRKCGQEINWQ